MRFNVVRVSIFVFVTIFLQPGRGAAFAQIDSQALGNTVSQQCSPLDPTCLAGSASQLGVGQIQPSMQPSQSQYPLQPGNLNPLQGATSTGLAEQLREQQLLLEQELMKSRLPLDAPTGFQQMVANSIGKMLPIYGASLFRNPPSTFAPVNQVPVDAGYVIGPGDELRIEAWGQVSLDSSFAVDRSGAIYIPQVGSVHVAGLRFDQAQPFLKTQIGRTFRNFDLSVSMGRLRSMQVFVVGEARRPGSWTISSLSTLVNAIFAVGGPTPEGSLRHIQLKRDGKLVVEFDLYDLLLRGDKSKDARLLPGDVIYFPPVGPQVAVAGSVKVPGIYELRSADNTTVEDVLDLAAGMSNVASGDKVRLERIDEHRERSIKEVALDAAGLATVVNDGDLLELEALAGLYKDAVTLRGNVASPGRYRWQPGMRVLDLIPNKEALVTRDYWLKRVQMGQPTLTYIPTCPPRTPFGVPSLRYGIAAGEEGEDPLWRYSTTTPQSARQLGAPIGVDGTKAALAGSSQTGGIYLYGYPGSPGNPSNPASSGSPAVTDGGLDCDTGQQSTQPSGQPTDQQTGQPTMNDSTASTSAAAAFVGVTAGSATAGQFTPRNDVKLSEPDIDWSYAVIERQNKQDLTTSLLPFNLGRAVLAGDASQNLELMPGDVVTIFSKADIRVPQAEQTRFVRLE
ncbi:MAG: SLBB domain-containing protein, partial [Acidobacteriaceae bacterium]|nr:SLBB domain-containing protein [Acidobacteriaceae bacterium]